MRVDILTLFPQMFVGPFDASILGRARDAGFLDLRITDIRQFAADRHRTVDDAPYGGGPGMVMMPGPVFDAVKSVRQPDSHVILLSPQGRLFRQCVAQQLSILPHIVLICGHYEGVDERVRQHVADDELSIGDYVLTGGELPAMVVIDAVARLLPGVLGAEASVLEESHASGLLEYPQYTRPANFRGHAVPDVLLGGNHGEIARWRRSQALQRTRERRPDLLRGHDLEDLDQLEGSSDSTT